MTKPWIWLRVAAALQAFFAVGHTLGGTPRTAMRGAQEQALFTAMQTFHFDAMGANRSHWDFYRGFSLTIGVNLAIVAVLFWQLSNLTQTAPRLARPLVITLLISDVLLSALAWTYFFAAPGVTTILIALCLIATLFTLSRSDQRAQASD